MDIALVIFIICGAFVLIGIFVSIYIMKRQNAEVFQTVLHSLTRSLSRLHSRRAPETALENTDSQDINNGFCSHDFHGSPIHSSSPNTHQWPIGVAAGVAAPMVPSILMPVDGPPSYTSCNTVTPPPQYTAVFGPAPPNNVQLNGGPNNEEVVHDETEGFLYPPTYIESNSV